MGHAISSALSRHNFKPSHDCFSLQHPPSKEGALADRVKASHEQQDQRSLRMICTPSQKPSATGL